jgi:MFS transporter, ACS family, D-galactonate transporter
MASQELVANPGIIHGTRSRAMPAALSLLVISVFINYVDRGNLSIAAPLLKTELGLSASQLGILLSAFFLTYTAMLFVCGWFVDHFDVNRILALGFLLWSLATAATGVVHGFAMLLVVRLILGTGESVAFPCYSKILARHLPEHSRGFANGAIIAGMKLGPAAGTLGAGWLMTQYGWRPVFVGIGLVSLLWLPAWMKGRPRAESALHSPASPVGAKDVLRQPSFWALAGGGFCNAYALYFTITWLPFYLVHEQHMPMKDMVNTAALYYSVDAASALAIGWLTDFFIRRGFSPTLVRKSAMALGWMIAALGFLGCSWTGAHASLLWLFVAGMGCGIGNSGLWAFSQTFAGPRAAGKWTGLQNGLGNFAGVIGPALTGFTVDWTGHFRVALAITAGVCLLCAFIFVFLVPRLQPVIWRQSATGQWPQITTEAT